MVSLFNRYDQIIKRIVIPVFIEEEFSPAESTRIVIVDVFFCLSLCESLAHATLYPVISCIDYHYS